MIPSNARVPTTDPAEVLAERTIAEWPLGCRIIAESTKRLECHPRHHTAVAKRWVVLVAGCAAPGVLPSVVLRAAALVAERFEGR